MIIIKELPQEVALEGTISLESAKDEAEFCSLVASGRGLQVLLGP